MGIFNQQYCHYLSGCRVLIGQEEIHLKDQRPTLADENNQTCKPWSCHWPAQNLLSGQGQTNHENVKNHICASFIGSKAFDRYHCSNSSHDEDRTRGFALSAVYI